MSKRFSTAVVVASVVFSATLLLVAQQSPGVLSPVASPASPRVSANPLAGNPTAIQAARSSSAAPAKSAMVQQVRVTLAPRLRSPPSRSSTGTKTPRVFRTIRYGVEKTEMEAHPKFTDEETWQLVAFVKSLAGPPRRRTFTETYCIGCHGDWAKSGGLSLEGVLAH